MEALDVEKINQVCWNIARHVIDNYPDSSVDDLGQEIWAWIMENEPEVLGWSEEEWVARLYRRGYRVAYALARRDRAAYFGYEPQDEFFYSLTMIRRLLPLYFEERGPEEYEFLVPDRDIAMDFERAFSEIDGETAALLNYIYHGDDPEACTKALAVSYELTQDAASKRVQRAVTRLREALGGPSPYERVTRTVMSNAQAISITRRQYAS